MKERPILFSAPMVRAIIEGRKTQTRRIYKSLGIGSGMTPSCPYGVAGGRLWVRETFTKTTSTTSKGCVLYRADRKAREILCEDSGNGDSCAIGREVKALYANDDDIHYWQTSIHMPRWASRITLEIVSVRLERVQEISEEDAKAEGIQAKDCWNPISGRNGTKVLKDPILAYSQLWDCLNKQRGYGWSVNPWCWCITFKKL